MTKMKDEREGVDQLVGLVQKTFSGELSPREQLGVLSIEQAWQAARARRRWKSVVPLRALAFALAVAIAAPGAFLAYRHIARVMYQVVNGTVAADGRIIEEQAGTAVVFSEGSRLDVGGATRARIASTTPDGGRIVVEDGMVRADIVHRPRARWTVDAGPYSIRVTGTAFDVKWSAAEERLDFHMTRGSVVVTGPLIREGVALTAGMRLTARPRVGQLAIGEGRENLGASGSPAPTSGEPRVAPAPPAEALAGPGAGGEADRGERLSAPPAPPAGRADERRAGARRHERAHGWDRDLAEGAFQSVVTDAERGGLEQVLARASGADLAALSDAARYTHHTGTAWRALLALRARFPYAPQSRDTAFFLGGLAESGATDAGDGPGAEHAGGQAQARAIDWYDHYLRECPTGRFIGEAWGRKMVLTQRQRGVRAARPIAEEYLRRFPGGPYVTAAQKLVQAPE